ncbi:YihY/virulence factor BrkB family protein [Streptomyces brevispora]|uniref:YihY/virulence factor BrkB family protein n=1 Tax=Streptomyces brevispora TaxID=887462 RepID=UPI0037100C13
MDWLKKLPVIGPLVSRLMETHAWHSYERLERVHWARLAAAITFISFLALFPLIAVGAAIGAALLSTEQLHKIEYKIAEQVPGISDQLGIDNLVDHAGTVGLVAGALLLLTGIGWIGSMRDCLRAVWGMDDLDQGNPVIRRLKDAGVLFGLGGAALVTLAISSVGSVAIGWVADLINIPENGAGGVLLRIAALVVAVCADFLLLLYLLTLLPGVEPPRRRLVVAALIGAVGFELLKLLLGSYMKGVAAKSMYGAFGVPIALLLWINFTAKLLLFCAAWTATRSKGAEEPRPVGNGEARGGKARDVEASEGKAPERKAPEGKAPEGKAPEGKAPEGGARGGSTPGGRVSGEGGGAPGPAAASAG